MKTKIIKIHPEFPETDKISHCAKVIHQGGLVIFPTETVYGIAADFNNEKAMARLRTIKSRPLDKPFSVLVSQKDLISNYTPVTDTVVYKLIDEYWPGPLTVVVPGHEDAKDKTVGIRMPQNVIAINLVRESQCTVAAPSANPRGSPPPSTCQAALKDMDGLVDIAIDGGSAKFGQASSVIDFTCARQGTQSKPLVTRQGVITQAEVDCIAQKKIILFVCTGNSCRSVMAEYLLKGMLKGREDIEVLSAGTGVLFPSSASAQTLAVLKEKGIDASAHQSQPVNNILLHKADLILVMTGAHRAQVLERLPTVEKRVYLLREFADESAGSDMNLDIPDPIGKPADAYEECMRTVEDATTKIERLI